MLYELWYIEEDPSKATHYFSETGFFVSGKKGLDAPSVTDFVMLSLLSQGRKAALY